MNIFISLDTLMRPSQENNRAVNGREESSRSLQRFIVFRAHALSSEKNSKLDKIASKLIWCQSRMLRMSLRLNI